MTPIHYTIIPARPEAHLYRVTCTVADPILRDSDSRCLRGFPAAT